MLPELQHKIITAVLAQNPETGEIAYKEVLDTFRNETNVVVHVTVNDETFTCTEEHPFYVEGKGWVNAGALHAGMVVWLADGTKAIIEDVTIEYLDTPIAVYNFKVEDFHTYFVGYSGVLVHNASCGTTTTSDSTEELPGRSGALNQAKRDADIPRTAQPTKVEHVPMTEPEYAGGHVLKDDSGNVIYTREYHYMNQSGEEIVIQEHSAPHIGSQGPHFNVRPANNTRKGTVSGTKEHYPFKE